MKAVLIALMLGLLLLPVSTIAHDREHWNEDADHHGISIKSFNRWDIDDARFKIDDKQIIITDRLKIGDEIRITPEYELFVNGRQIRLSPAQRSLLKDYYDTTFLIRAEAKYVAYEGLKIGLKGADLGLKAVGGLMKMLLTGYDEAKFEADMERAGEKLEAEAEVLEERAERIEEMAEHWEEVGEELILGIPELNRLEWLAY